MSDTGIARAKTNEAHLPMANQTAKDPLDMNPKKFIPDVRNTGLDEEYPGALGIGEPFSFDQTLHRWSFRERIRNAEAFRAGDRPRGLTSTITERKLSKGIKWGVRVKPRSQEMRDSIQHSAHHGMQATRLQDKATRK